MYFSNVSEPNLRTLYVSIHTTYLANFIEVGDMAQ